MKLSKTLCIFALLSLTISSTTLAHSGRTDASGGHNCSASSKAKGLCSGYHYHNSGSSNDSSSGSSSTTTAPAPTPSYTPPKIPAGYVEVVKPTYSIFVNGTSVPNSTLKYPIISYKDITYFPMTYKFTQALALETV